MAEPRLLHGALGADGALLLWAEDASAAGAAARTPVAASADEVATLLASRLGWSAAAVRDEVRERRLSGRLPTGEACELLCLELGARGAIQLMSVVASEHRQIRRAAAELVFAPELEVIARLARHSGAIVLRQSFVPALQRDPGTGRYRARWRMAPDPATRDAIRTVAGALPAVATAFDVDGAGSEHPASARAERFIALLLDHLIRARLTASPVTIAARPGGSIHDRWLHALVSPDPVITAPEGALDRLAASIDEWQEHVRRESDSPFRLCFRLEEPADPTELEGEVDEGAPPRQAPGFLRYLVQSRDDPSVLVDLAEAWTPHGTVATTLRRLGMHQGAHLFAPLGEAARLFEPIADSLHEATPVGCHLETARAHAFLAGAAPMLEQAGFGVFIPAWWRGRSGRWSLGVRAQITTQLTGGRQGLDSLNLATLVGYDWRLAIGDAPLSRRELDQLAAQKSPLVRVRGRWVEIDAEELRAAIAHIERFRQDALTPSRGCSATLGELLRMSVGAGSGIGGLSVHGVDGAPADGAPDLAELLACLARHETPLDDTPPPEGLRATLRPYQQRGFAWLSYMGQLGLGACLADDMGLGKSVQALAAVQRAWELDPDDRRPSLIVCPTTVLTNWRHECERFTPDLPLIVHHGPSRLRADDLRDAFAHAAVVVTSYALLARDIAELQSVDWRAVVLDEAQNVKNPGTRHARAARSLRAPARFALTGTPIENHAGDLWSIMEFLNPGLLGTQADFRRKYLIPIQTGTFPEAVERLRTVTGPFLMRRTKTDRSVIQDLPDKLESTEHCQLTTEQVGLYEAIVREAATTLRMALGEARRSGIERRGLILATIAKLKQVCNHPAQLLADNSRIAGRSGKLQRLEELIDAVLDSGQRALVFTQFVQMGELLQRGLTETFGREVLFLHGGSSRAQRDRMVARFQDPGTQAPPILVLSLKAGGSGLNLTAATHVIHYDRWWNPATEEQATDRAFRIGQTRDVQVHTLVCSGTVEERIDHMLRQKRAVASSVIGSGEQWITELGDDELLELLQLRDASMLQPGELDDIDEREWRRARL